MGRSADAELFVCVKMTYAEVHPILTKKKTLKDLPPLEEDLTQDDILEIVDAICLTNYVKEPGILVGINDDGEIDDFYCGYRIHDCGVNAYYDGGAFISKETKFKKVLELSQKLSEQYSDKEVLLMTHISVG